MFFLHLKGICYISSLIVQRLCAPHDFFKGQILLSKRISFSSIYIPKTFKKKKKNTSLLFHFTPLNISYDMKLIKLSNSRLNSSSIKKIHLAKTEICFMQYQYRCKNH